MVLWSMHALRFCSALVFCQPKLLGLLCYEDDSIALSPRQCSLPSDLSSENSMRDSCGIRGIDLWLGCHFASHYYACSITIGVDSISSMSSQDLLQSVPFLQVSVAMLYYSIVMVSVGSSSGF